MNIPKKYNKFLIGIVVIIWSLVGYTIYDGFNTDELDDFVLLEPDHSLSEEKAIQRLIELDRDPFNSSLPNNRPSGVITSNKPTTENTVQWPNIVYKGYVFQGNGNKKAVAIQIGNSTQIMEVGKVINELSLIKATENEVVLRYNGETKTFEKLKK